MCDYESIKHVVTYNPADVEQHSDSTDFDDYSTTRNKNHHKRRKPFVKKTRAEKEYSITELPELRNVQKRNTLPKKSTFSCMHITRNGSNAEPGISKVNRLRNKISSILFGANRKGSPFVKSDAGNDCKVYCPDCRRRQMRKISRRHESYAPRSLYLVSDVSRGLMNIQTEDPDSYHLLARESVSYTNVLWSDSETDLSKEMLHRRRKDDELERKLKKDLKYRLYNEKQLKSRSQQYSRRHLYQVFATQNQYCQAESSRSPRLGSAAASGNGLPVTASGFWEFLVNKLNDRYQEAKSLPGSLICCKSNCGIMAKELKRGDRSVTSGSQTQPENSSFENSSNLRPKFNFSSVLSAQNGMSLVSSGKKKSSSTSMKSSSPLSKACDCKPDQINKAERVKKQETACECSPDQINQAERVKKSEAKSTQVLSTDSKSCQEPHDALTKVLKEKYNGEVLCIHNPPCVLINGCLNMPPQPIKSTPVSVWPVMADQLKPSNYFKCKQNKKAKCKKSDQASQYHPPYGELQKYPGGTVVKADKLMQSVCNHKPPCQVVPCCFKPNYNPLLVNSCVHVPMCNRKMEIDRLMEVDQGASVTCNDKAKCFVPESNRNYTVARGDVFTQATARMMCIHQPPCLMMPLCQARVICDSVAPYQATPDCMHLPPCALVPACFRRYVSNAVSTITLPFNKGVNIRIPESAKTTSN